MGTYRGDEIMEDFKTEYKGFIILFREDSDQWHLENDCETCSKSLKTIKSYIDNFTKADFKRFPVYIRTWDKEIYSEATVTSMDGKEAWIVLPNGKRRKERLTDLVISNDKNKMLITEIVNCQKELTKYQRGIGELENQLEKAQSETK